MIGIFLGVAFPIHEFAHAWVAYMRGDATAKLFGRMTLNPIVHFDPIGGLMTIDLDLPGRVPDRLGEADAGQHQRPARPPQRRVLVALAGPASNLVMAILGAIVVRIVLGLAGIELPGSGARALWSNFVVFNVALDLQPDPDPAAGRLDAAVPVPAAAPGMADPAVPRASTGSSSCWPSSSSRPAAAGLIYEIAFSWWAAKARQLRCTYGRVSPGSTERGGLATPAELALFDAQHVADRRHGLDVVAAAARRVCRPRRARGGPAPRLRQGRHRRGPRVAWSLGERRAVGLARRGCCPAGRRARPAAGPRGGSADALAAAGLPSRAADSCATRRSRRPRVRPSLQAADEAC